MRYGYGFACLVAAVFCLFAYTATCQAMPHSDNAKIATWIDDISGWVPINMVDVEVKVGFCPGLDPARAGGCYNSDEKTAWIAPDSVTEDTVAHEIGHAFDDQLMDDGNRNKIINRIFRLYGKIWMPYGGEDAMSKCPMKNICPNEMFADGFAACSQHTDPTSYRDIYNRLHWDAVGGYAVEWTRFLAKHLCRIIDKIGALHEPY